ncbi:helix-turn-helix domain-containing protein [Flavihumibacter sp. UBA7668]|uniref:helix-turn-helix domain-containing protein n=1 Tax=Flavihumibacter sp. UBA7668 TaxID=1946542 RepID=UPI0025BB2BAD|nr:helix-turn-helix domain-containing protein [Flavihumibacter sp. UBA7668]
MTSHDSTNRPLDLAMRFILHTHRSVFLTGRAGTGKTSFLKTIRELCSKKMAVVAPTGVAAINAGGVTMHTFFQLPLGAFVPSGSIPDSGEQLFNNKASMLRNLRFSQPKRDLFQELELLVIDEVSMVRADLLDAVDAVLRFIRKKPQLPFGGVQVLFIGDLWQLPPVVSDKEWVFLKEHYASPFFFDAAVMKEAQPFVIELKKIYRQTDPVFIELLNKVRNNQLDQISWHALHEHYQPGFQSGKEEHYITLSTHNSRADSINQQELNRLEGNLFRYEAEISGDFGEKSYPAEEVLELRVGAQIMFIKNDKGEFRRFYNGKIGVVEALDDEQIQVGFPGEDVPLILEKETWKNIRYKLDKAKDKIEEEELGTFSQYPVRLAWAITIHKSQGLTFEKAIVDAGAAFAPGQVYVALSRLTGLEGLVLKTRIPISAIQTDERVISFTGSELPESALEQALSSAEREYVLDYFIQCFSLDGLETSAADWYHEIEKKTSVSKWEMLEAYRLFQEKVQKMQQVAAKTVNHFRSQLLNSEGANGDYLFQRSKDAVQYFAPFFNELIKLVEEHGIAMKKEPRLTKYQRELNQLMEAIDLRRKKMEQVVPIAEGLKNMLPTNEISDLIQGLGKRKVETKNSEEKKVKKEGPKEPRKEPGSSVKESLDLCKQGMSIREIAEIRLFAISTIEGHLVKGILQGDLEPHYLVSEEIRSLVKAGVEKLGSAQLGPLKEHLGDSISYTQIKATLAYSSWLQEQESVKESKKQV